jgi:hypothetical protein
MVTLLAQWILWGHRGYGLSAGMKDFSTNTMQMAKKPISNQKFPVMVLSSLPVRQSIPVRCHP